MGRKAGGAGVLEGTEIWWLVTAPIDFRCGIDRLLVQVREVLGRDPLDGSAYVFRNRRSTRIKVLGGGCPGRLAIDAPATPGALLLAIRRGVVVIESHTISMVVCRR